MLDETMANFPSLAEFVQIPTRDNLGMVFPDHPGHYPSHKVKSVWYGPYPDQCSGERGFGGEGSRGQPPSSTYYVGTHSGRKLASSSTFLQNVLLELLGLLQTQVQEPQTGFLDVVVRREH